MGLFDLFGKKSRIPDLSKDDILWLNSALNDIVFIFSPHEAIRTGELSREIDLSREDGTGNEIEKFALHLALQMQIPQKIRVVLIKDLRDIPETPYQSAGEDFISDFSMSGDEVVLFFANNLIKHPRTLIYRMLIELTRTRIVNMGMVVDTKLADEEYLQFALIYQGFGPVIWECGWEYGVTRDQFWMERFDFRSSVPRALFMAMVGWSSALTNQSLDWGKWYSDELLNQLQQIREEAILAIPDGLHNSYALRLELDETWKLADQRSYSQAIDKLKSVIKNTTDPKLLANELNNIGYFLQLDGKHKESIEYFEKAIGLDPGFPYPYNNLGFAYLLLGETERGLELTNIAGSMEHDEPGFAYRNRAFYEILSGESDKAEKLFKKAYEFDGPEVEYLDALFAVFLMKQGHSDKAADLIRLVESNGIPGEQELVRNPDRYL